MKRVEFLAAVSKVEGNITTVMLGDITNKSHLVTVGAENIRGDEVSFVIPTEEAPTINTLVRVTVEEVT